MKKKLSDLVAGAKELKNQATKIGSEAKKTAAGVKDAVGLGIGVSKSAMEKAGKIINKEKLSQGLEVTSKGLDTAAKGAKSLAKTMEKASDSVKQASQKLKK